MRLKWLCAGLAAIASLLVLTASAFASHDVTERLSYGPIGGNGANAATFRGMSADASHVLFQTTEQLVSADTDSATDVYDRSNGTTTLVSTGPTGGNGAFAATFPTCSTGPACGLSSDASKIFFRTAEKLVSADTDNAMDIYLRSAGTTTLISVGPNGGNGTQNVFFRANTPDGSRVFFDTAESLISSDSDIARDVYQWASGTVTRLSTGPTGGNDSDFDAFYEGASNDGTRVFLSTDESWTSTDSDPMSDVYERFGSTTTHLSIGPAGGNGNVDFDYDAFYDGNSADGTKVWLDTDEKLTTDDTDDAYDVYERSGATIARISAGPAGGNDVIDVSFDAGSADGSRVYFDTIEPLVAGDTDFSADLYMRSGGTTTLQSIGPAGGNGGEFVSFGGITGTAGTILYFVTPESLVATDTDGFEDVYQRDVVAGTTTLISTGPNGGNAPNPSFYAGVAGTAPDLRVFFTTDEQISPSDTDLGIDIYERQVSASTTTHLTEGHNGNDQDINVSYRGASTDGTKVVYETLEPLLAEDTDAALDVYAAKHATLGGYPRPKGATSVRFPLTAAFAACTTPNRAHGGGLSFDSCNPPVQTSPLLTIGTPDVNGQTSNANFGYISFKAVGVAGGADDSDVQITTQVNDIRNTSDLTDYTGELQLDATLQITDKDGANLVPGTMTLPLKVTIPCTPTVSTTIGSACAVTTTADTLTPGMVPEGRRIIWELPSAQVLDGGPDNLASTADNNVFQKTSLFVP